MFDIKDLTDDDTAEAFPNIPLKNRKAAAYRLTQYFRVIARIYDRMEREGKVPKTLDRLAEKRRKRMKRKGDR